MAEVQCEQSRRFGGNVRTKHKYEEKVRSL